MKRINRLKSVSRIALTGLLGSALCACASDREYADPDITQTVQNQLFEDPGVFSNQIDAKTDEGVVTLSGTVDNIRGKERAVRDAEIVKGVRSVVNRIQVSPPSRSDTAIEKDIKDALIADPVTEPWEINVAVKGEGVATATGTVDSWQERNLAANVIKGVRGVTALQNDLKVSYQTPRTDPEIRAEIKQRLHWDALVDDALINVATRNGKVTLTGTVGSAAEKSRAESDAWVAGVNSVTADGLDVEFWARNPRLRESKYAARSDNAIENAIHDAFLYDPRVLSFDVQSQVKNGEATLSGIVDNLKAKQAAAQDARNTVGVWYVRNQIKVRPLLPSNDVLSRNVRDALKRDPYLDQDQIDVTVSSGNVYLTGTVDNSFEKAEADDVAAGVAGVVQVHNQLTAENTWLSYNPYIGGLYPFDYDWYHSPTQRGETDMEITQDIRNQLYWSPFVDSDQVKANVDDGVATLTGTVDTWNEYKAAAENAREGGAIAVVNDLQVEHNPGAS